jgi:hypothetical protein
MEPARTVTPAQKPAAGVARLAGRVHYSKRDESVQPVHQPMLE